MSMNNIKELREELVTIFDELKEDNIDYKKAKEITNIAGKIIQSTKVEIDYAKLNRTKKKIDFLDY